MSHGKRIWSWSLVVACGIAYSVYSSGWRVVQHCGNPQVCTGTGDQYYCSYQQVCYVTYEPDPDSGVDRTGNIGGGSGTAPPVNLPERTMDRNQDSKMDCWKSVTSNSRLSSGFPYRNDGITRHNGIDVVSDTGSDYGRGSAIFSLGAGRVAEVGHTTANGNFIRINQGDGNQVTYIHLLNLPTYAIGAEIAVGQTIGLMNCTGYCGGPNTTGQGPIQSTHVHIQVRNIGSGNLVSPIDQYGGATCGSTGTNPPPGSGCAGVCP